MLDLFKNFLLKFLPSFSDIDHYNTVYNNLSPNIHSQSYPQCLPSYITPPYEYYLSFMSSIPDQLTILEIGSGSGLFSDSLVYLKSQIILSDLSPVSLDFLRKKYSHYTNVTYVCCSIESLPFDDNSFDYIFSAGTLSYGDPSIVFSEVFRILKPQGHFIAVDSLNNNPLNYLYRFGSVLLSRRSYSTFTHMPTIKSLYLNTLAFGSLRVRYFGKLTCVFHVLPFLFSIKPIKRFSSFLDNSTLANFLAFKFVLILRKHQ